MPYIDTTAATNGTGTELSPYNTVSGLTWGSNDRWFIKRGSRITETLTLTGTVANLVFEPYGDGPAPVFDCEGVRPVAFDMNSKDAITVRGMRFVNQDSSANGAIRLSGSTAGTRRIVEDCEFYNCRLSVLINASVNNIVRRNKIDVGNTNTTSIAYGIRVNSNLSAGNILEKNEIFSTAGLVYGTGIEVFAGVGTIISRNTINAYSCDGILMRSAATGNVVESTLIAGDMKDLIAFENASGNTVRNVTLWQTGAIGSTFPCVKLGNDFGAGSPAGLNDFQNMLIVSFGELPIVIGDGAATNTLNHCRIWRPGQNLLMRNDVFGGASEQFLTHAEMQAAGYNVSGSEGDPTVSASYIPLPGSPLLTQGADLGYRRDIRGVLSRKHIGAYGYARFR